jgi:hypothetical protein
MEQEHKGITKMLPSEETSRKSRESGRKAFSIVSNGTNPDTRPPLDRGPNWKVIRARLLDAYALLGHNPADDTGEHQVTGVDPDFDYNEERTDRERDRDRRAIFRSATADVRERPGIFAEFCARADELARADEAMRWLLEPKLHPDDEKSRIITVDWFAFGGPRLEREFCEAVQLSQLELRRQVRRCCEAIVKSLGEEPTRKHLAILDYKERDYGHRCETVVAAGRVFAGNDRGDRRRLFNALQDKDNQFVFGVEQIAKELRRTVANTQRKIDRDQLPVAKYLGQLCAHRELLRPFRERHLDRAERAERGLKTAA